jgi:hypothetical protein
LLGNCQRRRRKEHKGENTILFAAIDLEEYSLRYIIIFRGGFRGGGRPPKIRKKYDFFGVKT